MCEYGGSNKRGTRRDKGESLSSVTHSFVFHGYIYPEGPHRAETAEGLIL
jgi:hypothetical protein